MAVTLALATNAVPLIARFLPRCGRVVGPVVLGHAGAGHREAGEDRAGIERDQAGDLSPGDDEQQQRGEREHEDPVRVHEPVAPGGERTRQVGVRGDEAHEEGETVEAGVGPEDQDERRAELQRVVRNVAAGSLSEDRPADLREHRRRSSLERHGVGQRREHRYADEHHAEDRGHEHEGDACVADLRLAEDGDGIRDRLHPGHGRAAVRERPQEYEGGSAEQQAPASRADRNMAARLHRIVVEVTGHRDPNHSGDEQPGHAGEEPIGGYREYPARFSDAPKIPERQQQYEEDGQLHRVMGEDRERRDHGVDSGGHRHRNCEDVAAHQCRGGDLRHRITEVLPAHHVRAAAHRVCLHDLPVTEAYETEHHEQHQRHGSDEREGGDPGSRDEDAEDRLARIGARRHDVGRQDGERGRFAEPLGVQLVVRERRPEEPALHAVGAASRAGPGRGQKPAWKGP